MTDAPLTTPVLFLVFNRPDSTRQVFEAIREARPARLYVASDGPRPSVSSDQTQCEAVRSIVSEIDWECDVRTRFREQNLGCKRAVAEGVTWFFEHEEEGIILEDDCLPSPSFFPYCTTLLERYRHDTRVVHINGNNFNTRQIQNTPYSYHFVRFPQVWGWASWRRAWNRYDGEMKLLPEFGHHVFFRHLGVSERAFSEMRRRWEGVYRGEIDTWDYQWHFINLLEGSLVASPKQNLISNLGFDQQATHTRGNDPLKENLPTGQLDFPLQHPPCLFVDELLNGSYKKMMIRETLFTKIKRKLVASSLNLYV